MPKDYRERRIDEKPPRWLTRHAKQDTTEVAVPGDVTPDPFPEPVESSIEVITTFSGGGEVGAVATFYPPEPLASGDLYLIAYAYSNGTTGGGVTIAPRLTSWSSSSSGSNRGGVTTAKVSFAQAGATSFTVTVANGPTAYYGWILRGVQTGFSTPLLISAHDEALVSYAGSGLTPCESVITRTDWNGAAVLAAPAADSFGVYAATGRKGPCDDAIPMPTLTGSGSSVATGTLDGVVGYDFGTVSGGSGTTAVDATVGFHGTWAGLTMFAVGALAA
jgi:hypothetical protein